MAHPSPRSSEPGLLGRRPRRLRGTSALALLAAALLMLPLAAPTASAQSQSYFDIGSGERTVFQGNEIAGSQAGMRGDGTIVRRQKDALGGEVWRELDGSRELWVQPDPAGTGTRIAIDPKTGAIHILLER